MECLGHDSEQKPIPDALFLCSQIDEAEERIDCYDGVARQLKKADSLVGNRDPMSPDLPVSSTTRPSPRWHSEARKSNIDGSAVVAAWVESSEELDSHTPQPYRAILTVECQKGRTIAYVSNRSPLGIEETTIEFRTDNESPVRMELELSPDYRSVGWWTSETAITFLKTLITKRSFTIRLAPFRDKVIEPTFDLTGLKEAIAPVRRACRW